MLAVKLVLMQKQLKLLVMLVLRMLKMLLKLMEKCSVVADVVSAVVRVDYGNAAMFVFISILFKTSK